MGSLPSGPTPSQSQWDLRPQVSVTVPVRYLGFLSFLFFVGIVDYLTWESSGPLTVITVRFTVFWELTSSIPWLESVLDPYMGIDTLTPKFLGFHNCC